MTIIFPMNGKGERFKQAGYTTHKHAILLNGTPLLAHALQSYPDSASFYFFVRPEYREEVELIVAVSLGKTSYAIYTVPIETKGPVETLLYGATQVDLKGEVLLADCDASLNVKELEGALEVFRASGASGGTPIRTTEDPDCSYCLIDHERWILKTKEKDRYFILNDTDLFSKWSTTGPYWWRDFSQFLDCAVEAQKDGVYSVSPVFNYLIGRGGKVKGFPVSTFKHFGTPEALKQFTTY